jgi:anti-sigma B factor antagonist
MILGETLADGSALVRACGRIDTKSADQFQDALLGALSRAETAIAVDMSDVDHIGSAGLRALMTAQHSARAQGKGFALAGLKPQVREIFEIGRFTRLFALYPAATEALAAASRDRLCAAGA